MWTHVRKRLHISWLPRPATSSEEASGTPSKKVDAKELTDIAHGIRGEDLPPRRNAIFLQVVRVNQVVTTNAGPVRKDEVPRPPPGVAPDFIGRRPPSLDPPEDIVRRAVLRIDPAPVGLPPQLLPPPANPILLVGIGNGAVKAFSLLIPDSRRVLVQLLPEVHEEAALRIHGERFIGPEVTGPGNQGKGSGGGVQLRLSRSGRWYPCQRRGGDWQVIGRGDTDPLAAYDTRT